MDIKDTYKTIDRPSEEVLLKEKGSKFFGYCYPIQTEEDVKIIIDQLKKQHHTARHWCYSFQLGTDQIYYRVNDDGEPSGSAGLPIYGQTLSFDVTNILVVVVRYFGGTKLGVGGLVSAYKETAKMALEAAEILEKTIDSEYILKFDYKDMSRVMRIIKDRNLSIISQKLELKCEIEVAVRKGEVSQFLAAFESLYEVIIKEK